MLNINEIDVLFHELITIGYSDILSFYYDGDYDFNEFIDKLNNNIDDYKNNAIEIIKMCNNYDLHLKCWGRSYYEIPERCKNIYDTGDYSMFGDDDLFWLLDNENNVVLVINDYCQPIELERYGRVESDGIIDGYNLHPYKLNVITQQIIDNYNIIDME